MGCGVLYEQVRLGRLWAEVGEQDRRIAWGG